MNKILFPNCSEYVCRLKLTNSEKQYAREWAKKMNLDEKDFEIINEYFDEDNHTFEFTQDVLAQPYSEIIEKIETLRQAKFDDAELKGIITKEQIDDIKQILNKKGLPLDWELEQIISDYSNWKSLITKLMIVKDLQKGKKNRWDEDDK